MECRDICSQRPRKPRDSQQDDEDEWAEEFDKGDEEYMREEEERRRRAERMARQQNYAYSQGQMPPRLQYPPPQGMIQQLGMHVPRIPAGRSAYDSGPVLMDLNTTAYQRQRMAKEMARVEDINSNPNILMRENPDIFRMQPRPGSGTPDMYPIQDYYSGVAKDRAKVKTVTSNAHILSQKNPDIFGTLPRPGGFLKIATPGPAPSSELDVCERCMTVSDQQKKDQITHKSTNSVPSSRSSIHPVARETPSREFRIKRALEESDWETTVIDETDTVVGISNPYHLSMNMLAVTITCVMMMASKIDLTMEYLDWAEGYLRCIKDENNRTPRNIAGLLKEIKRRKGKLLEKEEKDQQNAKLSEQAAKEAEDVAEAMRRGKQQQMYPRRERPNNKGCRSTCSSSREQAKGTCTTTSSCTANKNVCAGFKLSNPCPNLRRPKCNPKCGNMLTVDDFVSPSPSQASNRK